MTDERDALLQQQRILEDTLEEQRELLQRREPDSAQVVEVVTACRTPAKTPVTKPSAPSGCEVVPLDGVAVHAIKRSLGLHDDADSEEATEHLYFQISSAAECLAKYVLGGASL